MSLGKSVNLSFFTAFGGLGGSIGPALALLAFLSVRQPRGTWAARCPEGSALGCPVLAPGPESAVSVLAFDGLLPLSAFCCDASGIPGDALAGSWLLCAAARPVA